MSYVELPGIGKERRKAKRKLKREIEHEQQCIRNIDGKFQSAKTRSEVDRLRNEREATEKRVRNLQARLNAVKDEQQKLYGKGVRITDHALVRYFERVLGYDLEAIKAAIVPVKTAEQIGVIKSGLFPVEDFRVRVKSGTVVTVVNKRKKSS